MRLPPLGLRAAREPDRPRVRGLLAAEADRPALKRIILVLLSIAGGLVVLTALTSKLYRIPAAAMEPTLHCPRDGEIPGCTGDEADRVAVSRVLYEIRDPKRGDIVAYKIPQLGAQRCGAEEGTPFLHRIVGLPGERVAVVRGVAVVNGRRLDEPYVHENRRTGAMPTRTLGPDEYLVLGDNRAQSCDSRVWGNLPRDRIIGPRIATYWPWDRLSIG